MQENEKKAQRSKIVHYSLQVTGIILIIAGVILSIPLVPGPGLLLIIIGVLLLGEESRLGKWLFNKIPQSVVEKMPQKIRYIIERRRSNDKKTAK
ncbi:MAG: hypothetical protein E3J54_04990 [Actinobacteria bacterium]|nr:MAG: hypothetical protein E3J54_04990 [Actinomycetota bacterium]